MNVKNSVAIIVPFYKESLSDYEKIAIKQCSKILGNHPIIAIKPKELTLPDLSEYIQFEKVITFDADYFKSLAGYNQLMLSENFYASFIDYEYILIHQLDCYVFKDDLNKWCNENWDYIGAPWIKRTYHKFKIQIEIAKFFERLKTKLIPRQKKNCSKFLLNKVGNGGFSLRRVSKFKDICVQMKTTIDFYNQHQNNLYNEDVFWSIEVNRNEKLLNIPDAATAIKFAFEVPPIKASRLTLSNLPFGCHDWDKYAKYWRPIFKKNGYDI